MRKDFSLQHICLSVCRTSASEGKMTLGKTFSNRFNEFSENIQRGEVISDPKNFVAFFRGVKMMNFREKGGSTQIQKISCKFSEKGGGPTPIRKILLQILVPPKKSAT